MPEVVGTAIVNIVPNTAAFNAAMGKMGTTASKAMGPATAAVGGLTGALTKAQTGLVNAGNAATKVGQGLTGVTIAAAAFGAIGIKAAYDFDTSMRRVGAITNATGEEFQKLDGLAQQLGRSTEYTAAQVADAMTNLALAGFTTEEILVSVEGTLKLASAGQLDLAESTSIAANTLRAFRFDADQIGRVADVLAKTMTNTNTTLYELAEGMKYAAPVAAASGVAYEEATAALGLMSNAGFQGSLAGTALRTSIARLEKPTSAARAVLNRLGVTTHDMEGNLLPLVDIMRQFEAANLSTADAITIFGLRAGPGTLGLLGQGAQALEDLTQKNILAGKEVETAARFFGFAEERTNAMRDAFLRAQPFVTGLGYNIDETSAFLAGFIKNGMSSEQAAATLAGAMKALQSDAILPLIGATRDMNGRLIDSEGQVLGFQEVLAILSSQGMTTAEALAVLGPEAGALAQAASLSQDQVGELAEKLRLGGTASEIAEKQMEGIRGGMLRLKSAVEGVAIIALGGQDGFINRVGDAADAVAEWLNVMVDLYPTATRTAIAIFLGAGAFGLLMRVVGSLLKSMGALLGVFTWFAKHPIILAMTVLAAVLIGAYKQSEAFREAISGLLDAFRGLWDVVSGLFTPAIENAGAAMEGTEESGGGLTAVLETIGDVLAPVVNGLSMLVGGLQTAVEFIGQFEVAATVLRGVLVGVGVALLAAFAPLTPFTALGAAVIGAIAGIGYALYSAYQNVQPFRDAIDSVIDVLQGFVSGVVDGLGKAWAIIQAVFSGDFSGAVDIVGGMLSGLSENLQRLPGAVTDLLGTAFDQVAGLADIGLGLVNRMFLTAMQSVGDMPVIGELVTAIYGGIRSQLETIGGIGDLLAGIFTLDPGRIGEGLEGIGQGILTTIQVQIPGLLGAVGDLFRDLIPNALNSLIGTVEDIPFFGDIASGVLGGLRSAFEAVGGVADLIAGLFTFDTERITDALGGIVGAVANFLTELPAKTLGALGDAGEWLGGIITSAADWVVENFPKLIEKLKDLPEMLVSAIGGLFGGGGGDGGGAAEAAAPGADEGNPVVRFFSTAITSAKDWIINDGIPTLGGAIADFVTRLPGILGGILGGIFRAGGAILGGILSLIGDWGGDIAEGLFSLLKWAFEWVVENGPGILAAIGGWLASLPGTLLGFLGDLGSTLLGWLGSAFSWLAENAGNAIGALLDWVAGLPAQIIQGLFTFAETLLTWMMDAWSWLVENGPMILSTVWGWISGIPGQILGVLGDLGGLLVGWITGAWGWVVENGPIILETLWAWISGLPGMLISTLGDLGSLLVGWITGAWNWIVTNGPTILAGVWEWIKGVPGTLIDTLGDIGGKIFDWLKGAFDFVVERGPDLISGVISFFSGLPGKIFDAIKGAVTGVGGAVSDVAKSLYNAVAGFLNDKMISPLRNVEFFGKKVLSFIPNIALLAEGGIIRVPTPAIVGEAGPEVVIPLTDAARAKELVAASGLMGLIAGDPLGGGVAPAGGGGFGLAVAPPPAAVDTGGVSRQVTGAMEAVTGSALTALQPVAEWFATAGPEAGVAMETFGEQVWSATESSLMFFVEQFTFMFDGLLLYLKQWPLLVGTLLAPFGINLWTVMSPGMAFFRASFEGVFAGIGNYLNTWLTSIRTGFSELPTFLSGIASQITSALAAPFRGFASGTWNPFAAAMNTALKQIPATAGITIPSLPTAHSGGVIGERLPQTGGPLAPDEMVVKMQRGEGVIPADVMRDMTPGEFEAIRSGGGLVMAKPQTDAWVRVPGTGEPYGPVMPAAQGTATGFVDASVVANLKGKVAEVQGSIRSLLAGFYMPRFLGGVTSRIVDESVKFVESKAAEQNRKAMEALGAGDAFPGGVLPMGLDAAIANVAAWRGRGGSYRALESYINAALPRGSFIITSRVRPGAVARGSGRASLHSMARAIDIAGPSGGRDTPELLRIFRAFAPVRNLLAEIIYSGPGGNYFGRSGPTADDHHDHVHVGLANGGLITRPMSALLGEAGPEVVLPLTRPMRALQLAEQSGLMDVLAGAQTASEGRTTAAAAAGGGDGGLFPGSGNTYNIYGVGMEQVVAEIRAREEAAARLRTTRR